MTLKTLVYVCSLAGITLVWRNKEKFWRMVSIFEGATVRFKVQLSVTRDWLWATSPAFSGDRNWAGLLQGFSDPICYFIYIVVFVAFLTRYRGRLSVGIVVGPTKTNWAFRLVARSFGPRNARFNPNRASLSLRPATTTNIGSALLAQPRRAIGAVDRS
jgi:hypothetical protein